MRWITRSRPKIDRIACPWLILRFVDPEAEFFYVPDSEVTQRAQELGAIPFDVEGVELSHDGPLCSFDAILLKHNLVDPALQVLATIVRGADTDRLDLAPQAAGLLAVSLGLSHNFKNDDEQLAVGMVVYDALYSWAKHARSERHSWNPQRSPDLEAGTVDLVVVFVCDHGSGKSLVAATHFNALARLRGLPYRALARGLEPDAKLPAGVVAGLASDGLEPALVAPIRFDPHEAERAVRIIRFGSAELEDRLPTDQAVWSVPPVSANYETARTAIVAAVERLLAELAG